MRYCKEIARANPALSHWETNQLLLMLVGIAPDVVLEIGTHQGGSARLWRDALRPDLTITVDWDPMLDDQDMDDIVVVRGHRSQDPIAQKAVREALAGRDVDFLFIDGGHSYDDVRADWDAYSPLVRRGGAIAFHDVLAEGTGVPQLWREVGEGGVTFHEPGRTGIGVVFR